MNKIKIIIDNVFAQVTGATEEIEQAIYEKLSFSVEEFGTDNVLIRHLFNRKTKKTYTGLISYVTEILEEFNVSYEIEDLRFKHQSNANFKLVEEIDIGNDKTVPLEMRPYQKEIIDRATERECIQAATGAGKTFIMAGLIAKFNVKPVLVFADKLSLVTQIRDEFQKFLGVEVGVIGGGINDIKDITICSVQSVVDNDELLKQAKMIMFDECMKYNTKILMADGTYKEIGKLVEEKSTEKVMSYNHKTGKVEPKKIISHSKTLLKKNNKKMMRLTIKKSDETLETIECTDNHKIWVESIGEYIKAGELVKGQKVKSINKIEDIIFLESIIENIEFIEMSEEEYEEMYVYDIGVEDNHNFFAENVLVHNCHHLPSATMAEIAKKASNAYYRIGVSATPWRDGGDDLLIEAILAKRKPEFAINASKLIELGYLVPCTIYFVPIKQVFPGKNFQKLYKKAIVENQERNNAVVKIAHKMMTTRNMTTLILIQHVAHGEELQKKLFELIPEESFTVQVQDPKSGKYTLVRVKNVEFLSGQDDAIRRKAVIQATKEKKVKILIGSTIADEGLDISSLDCLILAGGGKSSTRAFQRIGRVLRLHTNPDNTKKERALVFDFTDYTPTLRRHSRVREKLYLTEEKWDIKYFNPALLED